MRRGEEFTIVNVVTLLKGSVMVSGWPWAFTAIVVVLLSALVIVVRLPIAS